MRRQLLSLACGLKRTPQLTASHLSSFGPCTVLSYHTSQRLFSSSTPTSSPLVASQPPLTSDPTPSSSTTGRPSIRRPQRLWTADYVSPTKHLMNYLTHHGPQTRRTLYAIFGPTPTTPPHTSTTTSPTSTATSASPSNPSAATSTTAETIAASTVVQSHPSCLRSKTHLTTLLQQLTRTGRVTTRRTTTAPTTVVGRSSGRKGGGLFVYEMRNYETSWNKVRHVAEKGQKQRRKQVRLVEKAREEEERAATKERRRQRLEAGMASSS